MNGVDNAPVIKTLPDPLTSAERDRVLTELATRYDERIVAYFTFAFFTGMRPDEMIALRWSDIDIASGTVRVPRVRTFRSEEHTSELQSLIRISYADFCLKKQKYEHLTTSSD